MSQNSSTWVETDPQGCSRMLNALQLLARSVSFCLLQAAWVTLCKDIFEVPALPGAVGEDRQSHTVTPCSCLPRHLMRSPFPEQNKQKETRTHASSVPVC